MKVESKFCDLCGASIVDKNVLTGRVMSIKVRFGWYEGTKTYQDLCVDCGVRIMTSINEIKVEVKGRGKR